MATALALHRPDALPVLVALERARQQLAEARSLSEVKDIRDKAQAVGHYLAQRGVGVEVRNDAAEIVLLAERRLGEMLRSMVRRGGDRKSKSRYQNDTLKSLGVSKLRCSRWQTAARVPESIFAAWVEETRAAGKELTSGALFKLGRQQAKPPLPLESLADQTGGQIFASLADVIAAGQKFRCVYADPPWKYGNQATRSSTDNHYSTMTVEEICAEPVAELADETCHLYLWTTASFLPDAFRVITAWGFTYKSNMVWVKPQMGIGNYIRLAHEHLLIATKGKRRTDGKSQMSWIKADRTKHSRKPREFREAVERMSPGPRLEMYGREVMPDWTVYGNQIEGGRLFK
jgi:N6-adenosine-specific RNA methylase IME4